MENMSQECGDFFALPEHTTHFGCLSNQTPNGSALQKTMIKGHISFRSGDTEERALEAAVQFYETLKTWIGEIYHPEREAERWLSSRVSQLAVAALMDEMEGRIDIAQ